jgi:hypothetical protein
MEEAEHGLVLAVFVVHPIAGAEERGNRARSTASVE